MGAPTSLLQGARAFARDFARDQMPRGYLWDVVDYVPQIIDASLTGRGAWRWGSPVLDGDIETGILASFTAGEQLLAQSSAGTLYNVGLNPPYDTATSRGTVARGIQNPIQYLDSVVAFDGSSATVPRVITATTNNPMDASAPKAKVGAIWQDYVIAAGDPAFPDAVYWSK